MKQRLLFVVESGTDVRLVEGLAERFDLHLLMRRIEGGVEISRPPAVAVHGTLGPSGRAKFAIFVLRQLFRWRNWADAVLVQGYSLAALAANIARQVTGTPTMMLVCSPVEAYYRCRIDHPNGRPFVKHEAKILDALARANALMGERYVVLSDHLADVVRGHGARQVRKIPIYGVDTDIFRPPQPPKSALKRQLGLPATGTLIFFSSRVAPEKDSETLLRAFRQSLDQGHDLWLLHRSGGYRQFLADAESFGIAHRVIATDAVHPHVQLPLDYQVSDICVQASREEGLGFSPLEALACETPVIATAVGGLRETIIDGQTGYTYPAGDSKELAAKLLRAISDPREAHRLARNGRALVQRQFDRKAVFEQFVKLVESIAPPRPRSSRSGPSARKHRVLFVIHASRDGQTAVFRNTLQHEVYLRSIEHDSDLLAPEDFGFVQKFGGRLYPLTLAIAVAKYLSKFSDQYDVAEFHSYAGWLAILMRRYFGMFRSLRLVVKFHGLEPLYYRRQLEEVPLSARYRFVNGWLMPKLLRASCRNADAVLCLNSQEADYLAENGWAPKYRISVLSNPSYARLHGPHEYPIRATRLLFVGQWLPMKGAAYLVEAISEIAAECADLQLCCAGTLASADEVKRCFPGAIRDSVAVYPRLDHDDLLELFRAADIFVFPTLSEGFSLALIEAMSAGLPIVTSNVGAAPDVLVNEESALLVPARDSASLISSIKRLIDDQPLRERLGKAAQKRSERYLASESWREFRRAFNDVIEKPGVLDETRA